MTNDTADVHQRIARATAPRGPELLDFPVQDAIRRDIRGTVHRLAEGT